MIIQNLTENGKKRNISIRKFFMPILQNAPKREEWKR